MTSRASLSVLSWCDTADCSMLRPSAMLVTLSSRPSSRCRMASRVGSARILNILLAASIISCCCMFSPTYDCLFI